MFGKAGRIPERGKAHEFSNLAFAAASFPAVTKKRTIPDLSMQEPQREKQNRKVAAGKCRGAGAPNLPPGNLSAQIGRCLELGARELLPELREKLALFVTARQLSNGGFRGRSAESDLYFSMFGAECAALLDAPVDWRRLQTYLRPFGAGNELDAVHCACLLRCWVTASPTQVSLIAPLIGRLVKFQTTGIYTRFITELACDTAKSACPDAFFRCAIPPGESTAELLPDEDSLNQLATPEVAAVILLFLHDGRTGDELMAPLKNLVRRVAPQGGFAATLQAPAGDLLSTAVALLALAASGTLNDTVRDSALAFVERCWNGEAFESGLGDPPDLEYGFYGLLALGCVAECRHSS